MKNIIYIVFLLGVFNVRVVSGQVNDSSYTEKEIILETSTGQLSGTLCTPRELKKGPVALIIAGSGPTDRDGNSVVGIRTDAYKLLAHQLAGYGIATVRY